MFPGAGAGGGAGVSEGGATADTKNGGDLRGGRVNTVALLYGTGGRASSLSRLVLPARFSGERDLDADVELRIVLLHLAGTVLGSELLGDAGPLGGISDRDRPGAVLASLRRQTDRRRLQHVLVPVAVRSLHWKQVERLGLLDKPDRVGNFTAGRSARDGELNLVSAFQGLREFAECHISAPLGGVS